MNEEKVDIVEAATLFLHTDGPRGFLLRFALAYAVLASVLQAVSVYFQAPVYEIYLRAFIENDGDIMPYLDEINAVSGQTNLAALAVVPFSLALWVFFEAASQRRYMRGEGFRLSVGADEGRLALVGLIWIALLVVAYFVVAFAVAIPAAIAGVVFGLAGGVIVGLFGLLAGMGFALWLYARLSPASALTIRDRDIRFFEAWKLTAGHGRRLAASYLLVFLGLIIGSLVGYAVLILAAIGLLAPVFEAGAGGNTAARVSGAIQQPGFWAPMLALGAPLMAFFGAGAHAMGGPAAWIVGHQDRVNGDGITETFR